MQITIENIEFYPSQAELKLLQDRDLLFSYSILKKYKNGIIKVSDLSISQFKRYLKNMRKAFGKDYILHGDGIGWKENSNVYTNSSVVRLGLLQVIQDQYLHQQFQQTLTKIS